MKTKKSNVFELECGEAGITTRRDKHGLKQIEVVDLAGVGLDVTFQLAGVDPSDKVLHVSRDEEGWIGDEIWADADVALFDVLNRHFHRLRHLQPTGHHGQPTTTEGADRHFRLDVAHLAPLRLLRPSRTIEDSYVVQLVQER